MDTERIKIIDRSKFNGLEMQMSQVKERNIPFKKMDKKIKNFERTKPHVNVSMIGHRNHGKTTMTAFISFNYSRYFLKSFCKENQNLNDTLLQSQIRNITLIEFCPVMMKTKELITEKEPSPIEYKKVCLKREAIDNNDLKFVRKENGHSFLLIMGNSQILSNRVFPSTREHILLSSYLQQGDSKDFNWKIITKISKIMWIVDRSWALNTNFDSFLLSPTLKHKKSEYFGWYDTDLGDQFFFITLQFKIMKRVFRMLRHESAYQWLDNWLDHMKRHLSQHSFNQICYCNLDPSYIIVIKSVSNEMIEYLFKITKEQIICIKVIHTIQEVMGMAAKPQRHYKKETFKNSFKKLNEIEKQPNASPKFNKMTYL